VCGANFLAVRDGVASNELVFSAGGEELSYGSVFCVGPLGLENRFPTAREVWFGVDVVVPVDSVLGSGILAAVGIVLGARLPVARAAVSGCVHVYGGVVATEGRILVAGHSTIAGVVFDLNVVGAVGVVGARFSSTLLELGCDTTVVGAVGVVAVRIRVTSYTGVGADRATCSARLLPYCQTVTVIRGAV